MDLSESIEERKGCSGRLSIKEKQSQVTKSLLEEYANASTIHGVKYLGDGKRSCLERLLWFGVFIVSLYFCTWQILKVYDKFLNNPSEKLTPIWQIPFPAITVCPETKVMNSKIDLVDIYQRFKEDNYNPYIDKTHKLKLNDTELKLMAALQHVCQYGVPGLYYENFENETLVQNIEMLAPHCNDFVRTMRFGFSYVDDPKSMLRPIWTDEGVCYTFNFMPDEDIFSDDNANGMYEFAEHNKSLTLLWVKENNFTQYPLHSYSADILSGLYLQLEMNSNDNDIMCGLGGSLGFKISLQSPDEMSKVSKDYIKIPWNQEISIAIRPNVITTSQGLRSYDPNTRQCFFENERKLRYFKIYNQRNCEMECLSNYTLKTCGCVRFSMPRTTDIRICPFRLIYCILFAEENMLKEDFDNVLNEVDPKKGCNCLPSCTTTTYNAELSQGNFEWKELLKLRGKHNLLTTTKSNKIRLAVFFKENQFFTTVRSEVFDFTDFLAASGGILGLFMGVSIFSFIEIIYYFTIRSFCNFTIRRN